MNYSEVIKAVAQFIRITKQEPILIASCALVMHRLANVASDIDMVTTPKQDLVIHKTLLNGKQPDRFKGTGMRYYEVDVGDITYDFGPYPDWLNEDQDVTRIMGIRVLKIEALLAFYERFDPPRPKDAPRIAMLRKVLGVN